MISGFIEIFFFKKRKCEANLMVAICGSRAMNLVYSKKRVESQESVESDDGSWLKWIK